MLKRLQMTGQSMIARMAQLDVVSNNISNLNTKGFKRDNVFVHAFRKQIDRLARGQGQSQGNHPLSLIAGDFSQGSLMETKRSLDAAISGEGFFVVETPQGEAFTRNGRFNLNSESILVTSDGYPVLGEGGPIQINVDKNSPGDILINGKGEIVLDNNVLDKFQIVASDNPRDFSKQGQNLYQVRGQVREAEDYSIKQGFLEDSNVNAVREMVNMIEILRQFEVDQKVMRAEDQMLDQAVNQIARLR